MDTFILTHAHADHVMGMDDLRRFCDLNDGMAMPIYSTDEGLENWKSFLMQFVISLFLLDIPHLPRIQCQKI